MRKVLGILLALALTVGAFAGLTLLSVSAASRSALVNGEYLFEDFEGNSADYFNKPLGGDIALAKKADGAPTYAGSDYSLKFSGGTGAWVTPGISSANVKAVVNNQPGTYVLSAWVYFETLPTDGSTGMKAVWRNASTNSTFTCGSKTIEQGKWMFVSFMTTLNETWAQDDALYVMFDGIGKGSVFYLDNVTLAKVDDTFVATWYYNNAGAAFIGSGGFTGENIPAEDNKVSFTFYNLNDIDVTAQIELRASDWSTKTVSGAKQNLLSIPAHGNATIELDVSAGYDKTDFWIIYMKNGSSNLSGEDYIFGMELNGAADMTMFQKAGNKVIGAYYPVVGKITNSDVKKGSVAGLFGDTIVYGVQDTIKAIPVDGCSFDGWYSESNKVSSDAQYAMDTTDIIGVVEALEARFSGTPAPLTLGDGTLENSDAGWTYFSAAGKGTITRVDGGANNTDKAIQYVPGSGNQWGALAFDVGPAIIQDAENRYNGSGAAKYKLTFYARLVDNAAVDSGEFYIFLNSQYHKNANELAGLYGGAAADYVDMYKNYTAKNPLTFTKQWQKFEIEMEISEQYIAQIKTLYGKGVSNAYQLMIRFDGSEGIYATAANQNSGYLIDELSFEKMPDPTPTASPTEAAPTPTPVPDNTKTVENGDAENGTTGWYAFTAGDIEQVDGGADGTAHAIKYIPDGNKWGSIGFDFGPAIIQDEANGYKGAGVGEYTISFWAKVDSANASQNTKFKVLLNSRKHVMPKDGVIDGIEGSGYVNAFIVSSTVIELTDQWQKFEATVTVSEAYLRTIKALYDAGNPEAYQLILRLDGSETGLGYEDASKLFPYYVDEAKIEAPAQGEEADEVQGVTVKVVSADEGAGVFVKFDKFAGHLKDGKMTVKIHNTGKSEIKLVLEARLEDSAWTTVKAGETVTIAPDKVATLTIDCPDKATSPKDNKEYVSFMLLKIEGAKAGDQFTVYGFTRETMETQKPVSTITTAANGGPTANLVYGTTTKACPTGDMAPVAIIAIAAAACVMLGVVVAAKKKKEQE